MVVYKLEFFEGPLDLLLHLIDKAEIAIENISVAEITDQYLAYLMQMQEMDLEVTSEFLVLSATLLALKSQCLLPAPPVGEPRLVADEQENTLDLKEALISQLKEYREFKSLAKQLQQLEEKFSCVHMREAGDLASFGQSVTLNPVQDLNKMHLLNAFRKVLKRKSQVEKEIRYNEISVEDRVEEIATLFSQPNASNPQLFANLLTDHNARSYLIATFLAILELAKKNWLSCYQNLPFHEIVLTWIGKEEKVTHG